MQIAKAAIKKKEEICYRYWLEISTIHLFYFLFYNSIVK